MVAQHQFDGVGRKEDLPLEVGDAVLADIVGDQGDGYDERDQILPVMMLSFSV